MPLALFYYAAIFFLSFFLTLAYAVRWHKHFDIHMTAIFILIPIANLAYFLLYLHHEEAIGAVCLQITYIGGCFLPWLITMCIFHICHIQVPKWVRMGTLAVSSLVFAGVLTIGRLPIYYRSLSFEKIGSAWVLFKDYGPMHAVHYAWLCMYIITEILAIFYSYKKKKQVSRKVLLWLFMPIAVTMICYAANHYIFLTGYELVPLAYMLDQVAYLYIAHRMVLYNVNEMVVESLGQQGETAFITFDFKYRYLGSNETAIRMFPELKNIRVDGAITDSPNMKNSEKWLKDFSEDESRNTVFYKTKDKTYRIRIDYLYDGRFCRGYQFFITDDTKNQQYITLLNSFNEELKREVDEKTIHIRQMHDRLVLGMAAMVESRDHSTGGHIRRTSEGVRILVDAMRKNGMPSLSESFCQNVIKAAPMHDLGKIAVDDAILRKPGKFTSKEYEEMKKHAAEGARVVAEILQGTDDMEFRTIAVNVAHYHHERWDGTGYPDKLKGEQIPLESRIMSIADVYDALVSKRVYKEKMTFEQADAIITNGMGSQFDPGLQPYYELARPALENYYRSFE